MDNPHEVVEANLTTVFSDKDAQGSHVGKRLLNMIATARIERKPPFPRQIQIETSNICNHDCSFCAYTLMERPKKHMDRNLFHRLVDDAYKCGAREIGLFAGAEPLTCKWLDKYVAVCRDIGYEYIYISTNGALGDHDLFGRLLDAGLHSIKFSINGGDRETYKRVHGRDDFEKVLENLLFVSGYRRRVPQKTYLGVSFVGTPDTVESFATLKKSVAPFVDEIIYYEASNQSGQMPDLVDPPYRDCHLPFNKAHISVEGFLKACCNDYENFLALEDLSKVSLLDAWHSDRFQQLRQRHIDNDLKGTLCANCIRGEKSAPLPLNRDLVPKKTFWSLAPEDEFPGLKK